MVPSGAASRQVLIWSVPTLVILLSLVWYRRKRNTLRTDPGGTSDSASRVKETNGVEHRPTTKIESSDVLPDPVLSGKLTESPLQPRVEQVKEVCVQEETSVQVQEACVEDFLPVQEACIGDLLPVQEACVEDLDVKEACIEDLLRVQEACVGNRQVQEPCVEDLDVKEARVEDRQVQEACVEDLDVKQACIEDLLPVQEACVENLYPVQEACIEDLSVQEPCVEDRQVQEPCVEDLDVKEARVEDRQVQEACVEDLDVKEACIEDLLPVQEACVENLYPVQEACIEDLSVQEPCVEDRQVQEDQVQEVCVDQVPEACVEDQVQQVSVDQVVEACVEDRQVEQQVQQVSVEGCVEDQAQEACVPVCASGKLEAAQVEEQQSPKSDMGEENKTSDGATATATAAAAASATSATTPQETSEQKVVSKLASLTLDEQRSDADRDSANHSPVDAMLASPSLSNYSDEHSEGSSDSGKGCSDVASPPSRTPLRGSSLAGDADVDVDVDVEAETVDADADARYTVYEFLLSQSLVGKLIGRMGSFVQEIKSKTNATVQVKKHPLTHKYKVCLVEGTQSEVDAALAMVRERYPIRKYPSVTLEQVSVLSNVPTTCALIPEYFQMHLVEGVNNEVMVSCLVSPGHIFLQQPYHPTFQYLSRLSGAMNSVYSQADAPPVPEPITVGSICVAPATEGWYRVQVVSIDDEKHTCEVKFVDHGGYMTLNNSSLRQIHHDFMTLPFQATECYLASIKPTGGSNVWSEEALRLVDDLTRGQMLYAQVYDYTEYCIPLVYLYCCINSLVVLVNQELVARGLAELDDVAEAAATGASALVAAAAAGIAPAPAPLTGQQELKDASLSQVEAV